MLKKTIFLLSIVFLGTPIQSRPLEKLASFGKLTHDLVLFYTNHMITSIAHELGHALVYWFNDIPSRIVINANQKSIDRNRKALRVQQQQLGEEEKTPFPSFDINPIPSFYSVCIANEYMERKQEILCAAAGPVAGASTSLLLAGILPSPYFFENFSMSYMCGHLMNLIPFNLFGVKSDGYHIVEELGIV